MNLSTMTHSNCKCMSGMSVDEPCYAPAHTDGLCDICHDAGCIANDYCRAGVWAKYVGDRQTFVEWTGTHWQECGPDADDETERQEADGEAYVREVARKDDF